MTIETGTSDPAEKAVRYNIALLSSTLWLFFFPCAIYFLAVARANEGEEGSPFWVIGMPCLSLVSSITIGAVLISPLAKLASRRNPKIAMLAAFAATFVTFPGIVPYWLKLNLSPEFQSLQSALFPYVCIAHYLSVGFLIFLLVLIVKLK